MTTTMTEEEYLDLTNSYGGVCIKCGEIQEGGVEPDAQGYECPACGEPAVMGAEDALMRGFIEVED